MRLVDRPFDDLTMRIRVASVLLLLLSVGLVAAGCGTTAGPDRILSLATSAKKTSAVSGYRTETRISMTLPGLPDPLELEADGSVDAAARRQAMTMDLSQLLGALGGQAKASDLKLDMVMDGLTAYMRMPFATGSLPAGKTWVRMSLAQIAKAQGADLSSLMGQSYADPSQYLEYLTTVAGPVEEIGHEDVRGVSTTRVRGSIDLEKYVAGLDPATRRQLRPMVTRFSQMVGSSRPVVEAWVDGDDLVRRIAMSMSLGLPAGAAGAATADMKLAVTVDLYDFGGDVDVALPPADEVFDATSLALGRP